LIEPPAGKSKTRAKSVPNYLEPLSSPEPPDGCFESTLLFEKLIKFMHPDTYEELNPELQFVKIEFLS
jgi:hypothetical protein